MTTARHPALKICRRCKWVRGGIAAFHCVHPRALATVDPTMDLVSGAIDFRAYCWGQRRRGGVCGPDGALYEPGWLIRLCLKFFGETK